MTSDKFTRVVPAKTGRGLKRSLRRQTIALACLLLLICFVLGADHYRSAAILRTSKEVVGRSGKHLNLVSSPLTGGDICGTATEIGVLPYNDSGTTVAVNDDYDLPVAFIAPTVTGCPTCTATGGGPPEAGPRGGVYLGTGTAPDVAYSIEFSSSNNSLNVTLTPTGGSDLALIVYTDVCSDLLADAIVVDDDGGDGVAENVTISNMPAGTYHIVVDGYSTGGTPPGPSGPYTIAVTGSGVIVGPGAGISGTVTYGNAIGNPAPPRFVKTVSVASTVGSPPVGPVVTGTPGTYTLTGFGAGSYTITPTKPSGPNSAITSNDAARVAQGVTGTLPFVSNNQRFVADASGNGAISSLDAAKIAQFVAGVPVVPPNLTGNWSFFISNLPAFPAGAHPQSRTYASVTTLTGEDYIGLLIGEASGNWNPASHPRPVGSEAIAVALPNVEAPFGKEIVVPVSVQGVRDKDIISYEFDLRYDPAIIQPLENPVDVAGTVSRGLIAVTNPHEPGLLRVVLYGPMPIVEDGILLNLRFTAVDSTGSVSPLTFERIQFNDFDALNVVTGGEIRLSSTFD